MNLAKIARADFGSDLAVQNEYSLKERLIGFLSLVRPIFLLLTPLNAASAAVLSIRGIPVWELCLAGFATGAFAAAGVNIYNRYADAERDKIIWPWRPIPTGRVKAHQALALAIFFYGAALAMIGIFFNPLSFFILLAAVVLGSLYSSCLRDRVGYLSLPLIEGMIFLCGWACLSPGTLFTTALPWYLYFLGVVWQSGHILAHYVLNIRSDAGRGAVVRTLALFSRPSVRTVSRMTMGLAILLFLMSVWLPLLTHLSYLYVVPVASYGIYTLYRCRAFWKSPRDREKVHQAWSSLALFRTVISAAIILSVLVYR